MWAHDIVTFSELGGRYGRSVRTELDPMDYAESIADGRVIRCISDDDTFGPVIRVGTGDDAAYTLIVLGDSVRSGE